MRSTTVTTDAPAFGDTAAPIFEGLLATVTPESEVWSVFVLGRRTPAPAPAIEPTRVLSSGSELVLALEGRRLARAQQGPDTATIVLPGLRRAARQSGAPRVEPFEADEARDIIRALNYVEATEVRPAAGGAR